MKTLLTSHRDAILVISKNKTDHEEGHSSIGVNNDYKPEEMNIEFLNKRS